MSHSKGRSHVEILFKVAETGGQAGRCSRPAEHVPCRAGPRLPRQAVRLADAPSSGGRLARRKGADPPGHGGDDAARLRQRGPLQSRRVNRRATASSSTWRILRSAWQSRRAEPQGHLPGPYPFLIPAKLGRVGGRNRRATAASMVSSPPPLLRRREVGKAAESKPPALPVIAPMRAGPPHAGEAASLIEIGFSFNDAARR